jgi:hypothetical protein
VREKESGKDRRCGSMRKFVAELRWIGAGLIPGMVAGFEVHGDGMSFLGCRLYIFGSGG